MQRNLNFLFSSLLSLIYPYNEQETNNYEFIQALRAALWVYTLLLFFYLICEISIFEFFRYFIKKVNSETLYYPKIQIVLFGQINLEIIFSVFVLVSILQECFKLKTKKDTINNIIFFKFIVVIFIILFVLASIYKLR